MRTDYERLAARYDEDRATWAIPPDDVIASTKPRRVLDLGCGTGRWLASQRGAACEFFGAEPSDAMLTAARAKALPGLVRAAAEHLPFANATFGYVVSSYAFHHFADKERALDEIARVMTDDGVFRLHNVEPTSSRGWWVYEYFPETRTIDAERFWSPDRISAALEARGFGVDVQIDTDRELIPSSDAIADAERRVISQLSVLADAPYDEGLARLRAAGPTIATTFARLHLTASRDVRAGGH